MDEVEKKLKEYYGQRKREDEKSIPAFDNFIHKQEQARLPVQWHTVFKVAASVIGVVALLSWYFFYSGRRVKQTVEIYPVDLNQPLPSQSLLYKNLNTTYIWQWKSPTDHLLQDARRSLKTVTY
ncbi:MAG: hypothetical protein ABIN97_11665 [Ginsengibacter sp.]